MTNPPTKPDISEDGICHEHMIMGCTLNHSSAKPDISEELRAIHNRFHGRYDTHKEVAKHSGWTAQELENVQIEDELLMYDEIQTLIAKKQLEAEKAYGGCRKCYGKGYSTVIEYASGFDTDQDIGSNRGKIKYQKPIIRYCTCDRGKQLNGHVNEARVDESDKILKDMEARYRKYAGRNQFTDREAVAGYGAAVRGLKESNRFAAQLTKKGEA